MAHANCDLVELRLATRNPTFGFAPIPVLQTALTTSDKRTVPAPFGRSHESRLQNDATLRACARPHMPPYELLVRPTGSLQGWRSRIYTAPLVTARWRRPPQSWASRSRDERFRLRLRPLRGGALVRSDPRYLHRIRGHSYQGTPERRPGASAPRASGPTRQRHRDVQRPPVRDRPWDPQP